MSTSLSMTGFFVVLGVAGIFDPAGNEALAYTETCTGPATVYEVKTAISVPDRNFDEFEHALHRFADEEGYFYLVDVTDTPKNISGFLIKKGTAEGIHILGLKSGTLSVEMTECGSEGFRPYWEEFMAFVKRYVATRPDYPL